MRLPKKVIIATVILFIMTFITAMIVGIYYLSNGNVFVNKEENEDFNELKKIAKDVVKDWSTDHQLYSGELTGGGFRISPIISLAISDREITDEEGEDQNVFMPLMVAFLDFEPKGHNLSIEVRKTGTTAEEAVDLTLERYKSLEDLYDIIALNHYSTNHIENIISENQDAIDSGVKEKHEYVIKTDEGIEIWIWDDEETEKSDDPEDEEFKNGIIEYTMSIFYETEYDLDSIKKYADKMREENS